MREKIQKMRDYFTPNRRLFISLIFGWSVVLIFFISFPLLDNVLGLFVGGILLSIRYSMIKPFLKASASGAGIVGGASILDMLFSNRENQGNLTMGVLIGVIFGLVLILIKNTIISLYYLALETYEFVKLKKAESSPAPIPTQPFNNDDSPLLDIDPDEMIKDPSKYGLVPSGSERLMVEGLKEEDKLKLPMFGATFYHRQNLPTICEVELNKAFNNSGIHTGAEVVSIKVSGYEDEYNISSLNDLKKVHDALSTDTKLIIQLLIGRGTEVEQMQGYHVEVAS